MTVRCHLVAAVGAAILTATACADSVTPVVSRLAFEGQAPDSTLVLLMSFHFEDGDGDLGTGELETFINGQATSAGVLPLLPIFVANAVSVDAPAGDLEFVLELSFARAESEWPKPGSTFRLGARVTDGAGHTSTTEQVVLRVDYEGDAEAP